MISNHQRRAVKVIAVLALVFALVLLLLPQTSGSHAAPILWLALVPVFLFGIVDTSPSQRLPTESKDPARDCQPARSALFQRPPPSSLA